MAKFYIGDSRAVPAISLQLIGLPRTVSGSTINQSSNTSYNLSPDITTIGSKAFYYAFMENLNIRTLSFPSVTTVNTSGCRNMCQNCMYVNTVSFPNLVTTTSNSFNSAFNGCSALTTISFPKILTLNTESVFSNAFCGARLTSIPFPALTTVSGKQALQGAFGSCNSLVNASFPALTTVSGQQALYYLFSSCSNLETISFPNLTTISGANALQYLIGWGATKFKTLTIGGTTAINFGSYTNQFTSMLQGCTGTNQSVTVKAPKANQATIEAMSGYPKFGAGANCTVNWVWQE